MDGTRLFVHLTDLGTLATAAQFFIINLTNNAPRELANSLLGLCVPLLQPSNVLCFKEDILAIQLLSISYVHSYCEPHSHWLHHTAYVQKLIISSKNIFKANALRICYLSVLNLLKTHSCK